MSLNEPTLKKLLAETIAAALEEYVLPKFDQVNARLE